MARRAALCGLLALGLAACSGQSGDLLSQASSATAQVHSGVISLRVATTAADGTAAGFQMRGPFDMGGSGMPRLDVSYTQFAGDQQRQFGLRSTGDRAFLSNAGKFYELTGTRTAELRQHHGGGLGALQVGDWVSQPRVSPGPSLDGVSTDHVVAAVDTPRMFAEMVSFMSDFGYTSPVGVPQVDAAGAAQLRAAVRSATFTMDVGHDDHVVRKLRVLVVFQAPSGATDPALQQFSGSTFALDLGVASPNQPVRIDAPANPLPYSALPTS